MKDRPLSHLDDKDRPRMVDVSGKEVTQRTAKAEAVVKFQPEAWEKLEASGFTTSKGSIFDVARIAGTMAVKQTASLIPFCHTLPIDGCSFDIEPVNEEAAIQIRCDVRCTAKTGVEMEAMTGVSVAALTLYDMTKSLGLGTSITKVQLIKKTGGKSDYGRDQ
ncbi:MAG: cyclic pyranopterin monophosphate synthase MoaC [Puniceicoccaceae bacterium]